jgi:exopolysaccharide biosynthesis polyprenyl glycosylphosphotransferase
LIVTIEFFMPQRYYSRRLIALFLAYGFVAVGVVRWALVRAGRMVPVGATARGLAIVGLGEDALLMEGRLERSGRSQWRTVGFIAPREIGGEEQAVGSDRILGTVYDLVSLVNEHAIEVVILATRYLGREEALALAMRCDQMGLRVLQVPFTWGLVSPKLRFAELGDLQLIDLSELSYPSLGEHFKRAFDLIAVTIGGLAILPITIAVALAVKSDGGPMFYASPRVGKGGRAFPFYKFRSMVVGADDLKADLMSRNETDGPLFKIKHDPRVTRVGRFIRKFSLDEFPQFLNVLRGDMNLVGPRPLPIGDLAGLENDPEAAYWFELRHKVPPGITGLWQVMGRSDLGFQEMVQLDIYYIQNWSPWLDLKILLLTLPAVLKGRGAA